ncbi:GNAT family N-acetyltransferase [Streptomycetaceae bacterium NBC_01309]
MIKQPSRVELHPLTHSDQDEFCSLVQASAELHLPWMQLPATAEEFRTWMRRFDDGTNLGFLVRVRETGAAAGTVNINSIIRGRYGDWRDHERWAVTAPSPWTPDPSLPEV